MRTIKKQILLLLLLSIPLISYGQADNEPLETYSPKGSLSLRTNVIHWFITMPNLGLEYKTSDHIGLLIDGGWAHWRLSPRIRYWRMWNIAPQARYYFTEAKYNYIGV